MKRIEGIIVPMITPLTEDFALDYPGLERLVNHLVDGGVAALFPLGTTGEGPLFSLEFQQEVNRAVCRFAAGRRPVLTGVSGASPEDTIKQGIEAAKAGSQGIVVAPPCYFPMTEDELVDFYTMVTSRTGLPVFVYNMPGMTKVFMKPALIERLAQIPGISGYKDSSNDMNSLHETLLALKNKPEFPIFVGPDSLMAENVMLGGAGGVNSGANLYPEVYVSCWKEMRAGNLQGMMRWQEKIDTIQRIYKVFGGFNAVAMGLKSGLKVRGICGNAMMPPLQQPTPELEQKIRDIMKDIDAM